MTGRGRATLTRLVAGSVNLVPWWLRDRIRHIPGVAAVQRNLIRRTLDGAEFVHAINAGPAAGLRMRVQLPKDKLYWTGTWENNVTQVLAAQIEAGSVCYDVGGHRGFMAGVMALNGARQVYCFEPNPANIVTIEDLLDLNPEIGIRLMPCAVGASDGVVGFTVMTDEAMGKLIESSFQREVQGACEIQVRMRSLDSLVAAGEIEPPQLVKIDIEGAEAMALAGAEKVIVTHHPRLLIEIHSWELLGRCRQWLEERGYRCSILEARWESISEASFKVCHLVAVPQ